MESKIKYEELFNSISSCIAIYEATDNGNDFIFKDFNKAAEKADKIKKEDLTGKSVLKVFPGVKDFGLFDIFKRVYKTGKPESHPISIYKDSRISGWRENLVYKTSTGEIVAVYEDVTAKKQAEEELILANERLSLAQKSAGAGVWDWDMNTEKLNWSDEFYILFGLDPKKDNATFDTWRKVLHPEDRQRAEKKINESIKEHKPLFNEYRIIKPSGEVLWINALGNTIYDEHNKAVRMSGICIDITDRKKVEEALQESTKTLIEAQKVATIGSWSLDVLTQKAKWSKQIYSIFGLNPKDGELSYPQGHKEKLIYPDDWEKFEKTLNRSVSQGIGFNITVRFINQTNDKIGFMHAMCHTTKDMNGKVVKLIGTCQDITKTIKTRDTIEENNRHLSYLLEASGIGEWEWDVKNNKVYYSKKWEKILGYRDNEKGNALNEFIKRVHPDDKDQTLKILGGMYNSKSKKIKVEYRWLCKNGRYKWVRTIGNIVSRDKDGNPLRLAGVIMDISERKKREQEVISLARFPSENPHPILRVDYEGIILYLNKACKSIPGWKQKIGDIVVQNFLKKILAVVKSQTKETSILQFGGKTYIFTIVNITEFNYINLYGRDISDRIALEEALKKAIIEKDAIASAERIRMEKELHDSLSQTIFSTNLLADIIPSLWNKDRQEALKQLEKIKLLTKETQSQFRRILLELKPDAFLLEDLGDLIRQLAHSLEVRSEIPIHVSIKGKHNPSKEVKEAFYRICQEALNNIIKYSCASMVKIELECLPEKKCLKIKDNGVGFDKKKVSQKSLGLYIMRKRAKDINASLNIDSKIGRGTNIIIKL